MSTARTLRPRILRRRPRRRRRTSCLPCCRPDEIIRWRARPPPDARQRCRRTEEAFSLLRSSASSQGLPRLPEEIEVLFMVARRSYPLAPSGCDRLEPDRRGLSVRTRCWTGAAEDKACGEDQIATNNAGGWGPRALCSAAPRAAAPTRPREGKTY